MFLEYASLRRRIGSQDKAARILDVSVACIARRESGKNRITREAEFAIYWAAESEQLDPTADVTRLKPHSRRKK